MSGSYWQRLPWKFMGTLQVLSKAPLAPLGTLSGFAKIAEDKAEGFLLSDIFHYLTGFAHLHLLFPGFVIGTFPKSTTDEPAELSRIKFPDWAFDFFFFWAIAQVPAVGVFLLLDLSGKEQIELSLHVGRN